MVSTLPAHAGDEETWVRSLSLKDPLEKEVATHSSFSPGKFHGQRSLVSGNLWGRKASDTAEHTHTACCGNSNSVLKIVQVAC